MSGPFVMEDIEILLSSACSDEILKPKSSILQEKLKTEQAI